VCCSWCTVPWGLSRRGGRKRKVADLELKVIVGWVGEAEDEARGTLYDFYLSIESSTAASARPSGVQSGIIGFL